MKVRDIVVDLFEVERDKTTVRPRRFFTPEPHTFGLVKVIADEGIEGHALLVTDARQGKGTGEHMTRAVAGQILGLIKPEMVGRDVEDVGWLWSQLYVYRFWGRIHQRAWSSVDIALWDAAGKARGLPVCKLLGAARERIPAYTNISFCEEIEPQVEQAREARRRGYRGVKLHPGTLPPATVEALAARAREAVGDQMHAMDDEATTRDAESALRIGRCLQDLGYLWFEDPLRHTDVDGYRWLCRRLDIPVGWTDHHEADFDSSVTMMRGNPDLRILRGDSMRFGITALRKLCDVAEGLGLRCEIHSGNMANLHVALSVHNCTFFENTIHWPEGEEIPSDHPLALDADGCIRAPTTPGVGEPIDYELVRRRHVDTLT